MVNELSIHHKPHIYIIHYKPHTSHHLSLTAFAKAPADKDRQPPTVNYLWNPFLAASQLNCAGSILIHSSDKTDFMEPIDMLKADPLDILLENRNKLYGAYPLRKFYAQRLYISMGTTLSAVFLFSIFYLYFHTNPIIKITGPLPDYHLEPVVLVQPPKPIAPPARPLISKPPAATVPNTIPLIVPPDKPIQPVATISELDHSEIGVKTIAGGQADGERIGNGNLKSEGIIQAAGQVESKPEVFRTADVMPEFPGGIEALKRYLNRNLRMPESSLEPGSIVHVIARFVVGADGRVRDIEIIQAADAVFNLEVKRVISKMPDWKPGSQNQRNVAVYFDLPVNFVITE